MHNTNISTHTISRLSSENGAIVVMTTLLLMLACFTAIIIADLGQLIFEKTRLQNSADAAALSAATVQSAGLNEIADLNYEIHDQLGKLRQIMANPLVPWSSMFQSNKAINFFKHEFVYLRGKQDSYNRKYARWAKDVGQKTIKSNQPANRSWSWNVNASTPLTSFSIPTDSPVLYYWFLPGSPEKAPPLPTMTWLDRRAYPREQAAAHDGRYYPPGVRPGYPIPGINTIRTWRKKVGATTKVEVSITQAPADFISAPKIIGKLPKLTARAVAKPTGGNIGSYKAEYRPMLTD